MVPVLPIPLSMVSFTRLVSRALRRWNRAGGAMHRTTPPRRQRVVFVGVPETSVVLDDVLEPGTYDLLFVTAPETAYPEILRAMPDHVVICLEADDETSLQLLTMLAIDPRTGRLNVITCVAGVSAAADEPTDAALARSLVTGRKALVMH